MVKDIDYTHKLSDYNRWFMWQIFQRIDDDVELYNFIVRHFNSVKPKEVRRAKVAEWENLLNYWIELSERLNAFEKSIIIDYYFGDLEMHEYTSIKNPTVEYDALYHKTLGIIENIDGIEDIPPIKQDNVVVIAGSDYNENEYPYEQYAELRRKKKVDNYNEFNKLPDDLKQSIVDFFFMYQEACAKAEEDYDDNDFYEITDDGRAKDHFMDYDEFVWSKAKHEAILERLLEGYFYNFRDSSILKKYENFFKENDLNEHIVPNSDDADKYFGVDTDLILTSYFIHYVLRSMGVKTKDDLLREIKIHKIDRSNVNSVQRLLCAITTKQTENLEKKGNSYYVTINRLFKFNSEFKDEKEKVLRYLNATQELLVKYGFMEAVKLLRQDYKIIENVEIKPKHLRN